MWTDNCEPFSHSIEPYSYIASMLEKIPLPPHLLLCVLHTIAVTSLCEGSMKGLSF